MSAPAATSSAPPPRQPAAGSGDREGPGPLAIEPAEREPLLAELDRLAAALGAGRESRHAGLREAVAAGSVPSALVAPLEEVLRVVLPSRSVRHFHGPGPERALLGLYRRTPGGAAAEAAAEAANRALELVRGDTVERIELRTGLPGEHRLTVATGRCRIAFEIGPDGVSAREVEL